MTPPPDFISGVIEGFYGPPWTLQERFQLFDWIKAAGLNTYMYAPKDDLKHRQLWREPYHETESLELSRSFSQARELGLRVVYGIAPGLDIRYSNPTELEHLRQKLSQAAKIGATDFALLFDDIPDSMHPADRAKLGTFAAAQCYIANTLAQELTGKLLFCPTPYCGRMRHAQLGGPDYLEELGAKLDPRIDIFWTGPEIISEFITADHLIALQKAVRRKPIIWDNLHANDYDGRRFYTGPYAGREPAILNETRGILLNPNTESSLNFVPIQTLGRFLANPQTYKPREAYLEALREWHPRFETVLRAIPFEDFVLFCDCFYLPFSDGDEAQKFLHEAERIVQGHALDAEEIELFLHQCRRLKDVCVKIPELKNRALFHALSRRIWDLREELDLLEKVVAHSAEYSTHSFLSDFHLSGTFRGGYISKLQKLLHQQPDGTWRPCHE